MTRARRAAALGLAALGLACLWDTDTLRDELLTQADDFDLITGQFPHHGKAYYEARLRRTEEALRGDRSRSAIRNDLAATYLRLGRFDEALREFEALHAELPGDYYTLSNLGVLHKKRGDFAKAAEYTAQALAIKPEGHLGLGDWYLKMLRYRRDTTAPGAPPPVENFLGTPYGEFPRTALTAEDYKNVVLLIRADRTFADALVLLGDYLHHQRHLNLALWAYVRARDLGHPHAREVDRRMELIFTHWNQAFADEGKRLRSPSEAIRVIREDLKRAAGWVETFERTEAELVAAGNAVDYGTVERTLRSRGIERFRPSDLAILAGGPSEGPPGSAAAVGMKTSASVAVPLLLLAVLLSLVLTVWVCAHSRPRIRIARRRTLPKSACTPLGA
jgi:tetratricopeptide (TPR) repeat protein